MWCVAENTVVAAAAAVGDAAGKKEEEEEGANALKVEGEKTPPLGLLKIPTPTPTPAEFSDLPRGRKAGGRETR